jgi:hypothetical protein
MSVAARPGRVFRWILSVATVCACLLAFAWPFAVSPDPANPVFRVLAIGTFVAVLGAIATLAYFRLRKAG